MRRIFCLLLVSLGLQLQIAAQECDFRLPMDVELDLAATFAELRPNHFHGGLDMRTEQVIGKHVYSVEDGYVSRISVSAYGYGNALYINHPCGITSVYGHLEYFAPKIEKVLKEKQYAEGRFDVDFELDSTALPLQRGELVAISGNTGSSTGPHLHFEFRKTGTEIMLDPQDFYDIPDNVRPRVHKFAITPVPGEGVVNGSAESTKFRVAAKSNGNYFYPGDSIRAWGRVGIEVSANDYLPANKFKFGLRRLTLIVDGQTCFEFDNDHYHMDSTRYINAFINYARWYEEREMYMRCYMLPNAYRDVFKNVRYGGYINIDEQRPYRVSLRMEDYKGNSTRLDFEIAGDSTSIPLLSVYNGGEYFPWNYANSISNDYFRFTLPSRSLYEDCYVNYSMEVDSVGYSDVHTIGDELVPLQNYAQVGIKLRNDSLDDKSKYYVAQRNRKGTGWYYAGTSRLDEEGFLNVKSRSFGTYKIMCDTIPPEIRQAQKTQGGVSFKVYDSQSGVGNFRGTVDGIPAIFYRDGKSNRIFCDFDHDKIAKGRTHTVVLEVDDNCGNRASRTTSVWW